MFLSNLESYFRLLGGYLWGWPLISFVAVSGISMTVAFGFAQFRYFGRSWKYIFKPESTGDEDKEKISPMQAFMGALSTSMGNGSLAGMATAIVAGGPGAVFWLFVLGFFTMIIRFTEIYASTAFTVKTERGVRGGPMIYLAMVPGGKVLPYIYMFFCLGLSYVTGNAMQCNSMTVGISHKFGVHPYFVAGAIFLFILYVILGGAKRIMVFSEVIAPIKVVMFFTATLAVLIYNYALIWPSIIIITKAAFSSHAVRGAAIGWTMQNAIRFGVARTLSATEAGLGNAGIFFGATGSKNPAQSAIMSMASAFLATLVCFLMVLAFVVSGAYTSGLTSTPMVSATYASVFGTFGGVIATSLSVMFGVGVLVAYAFIAREGWLFLTGGRWGWMSLALFCFMAVFGSLSQVSLVWAMIDIVTAGLIITNLYGLMVLLPRMRRGYYEHLKKIDS